MFSNFSKGSDFMLIEHYGTELTQSCDIIIIGHWMKITWNTIVLKEIVFL